MALIHFAVEEALMRLFDYPESDKHNAIHEHFLTRLEDILNRSIHKSADSEMLMFLQEWLTNHILGSDRDYARHILSGAALVRADNSTLVTASVEQPR